MVTGETLRHVLWIAQDFAAFTSVRVVKPGSNIMFELWPVRELSGKHKIKCWCHYCGMVQGPSCLLRSIPESGTPDVLRRRGIDLDDKGWYFDVSAMHEAIETINMLIQFRTGEKSEDNQEDEDD